VSDKEKLSASTWQRLIRRYVAFAFRRPITLIVLFTVMTVAATALAVSRLKVVTDLAELLPEGTVSVRALDESRKRIGSTDLFTIAIRSEVNDTAAVAALQAKLRAHILTHWKDAQWVQIGRDTSFFRQRALYFLPDDTLAKLKDYLERELDRYAAKSVPGIVDLDDDDDDDDNSASKTGAAKRVRTKTSAPTGTIRIFPGGWDCLATSPNSSIQHSRPTKRKRAPNSLRKKSNAAHSFESG
jgi:hypothetical protein